MEYFYGGGGRSDPDFVYRFLVKEITNDMWRWCEAYPLTGPFERWYVKRQRGPTGEVVHETITFESSKAAKMFRIAYSEYIIENKSIYSLDE